MGGKRRVLVLSFLVLGASSDARADSSPTFTETRHRVRLDLRNGVAKFKVSRRFVNSSSSAQSLWLETGLPGASAVDALRADSGRGWMRGRLLKAELADQAYEKNIVEGPRKSTRAAPVLVTYSEDTAHLRSPSLAPRQSVSVEYEITAPTCYSNGRYYVDYPVSRPTRFNNFSIPRITGPGIRVDSSLQAQLPKETKGLRQRACHGSHSAVTRRLVVSKAAPHRAQGRYAKSGIGKHRWARLEFELPTQLKPVPRGANLVFVIDASMSLPQGVVKEQLALSRSIAQQFPAAKVQIVVFRRDAEVLFDDFVAARKLDNAIWRIPKSRFRRGNGSHLDAGLALAAKVAAKRRGPIRIVAFTDSRMRARFRNQPVLESLKGVQGRSVVHLVDVQVESGADEPSEETAFGHRFEPIAHAHGGTVLNIDTSGTTEVARLAKVVKHLVSPQRIESFRIEGDEDFGLQLKSVPVGTGYRAFADSTGAATEIRIQGRVWGRPWQRVFKATRRFQKTSDKFFVVAMRFLIPDEELLKLALRVGVLSSETSFFAHKGAPYYDPQGGLLGGGVGWGST